MVYVKVCKCRSASVFSKILFLVIYYKSTFFYRLSATFVFLQNFLLLNIKLQMFDAVVV